MFLPSLFYLRRNIYFNIPPGEEGGEVDPTGDRRETVRLPFHLNRSNSVLSDNDDGDSYLNLLKKSAILHGSRYSGEK